MAKPNEPTAAQHRALDRVRPLTERLRLYLAGGTALAFHLHHRTSRDVDLFSLQPELDLEEVRECEWMLENARAALAARLPADP